MTRETRINRAIENHLGLWWTDEMIDAIRRDAGVEGLAKIQEIAAFANTPALWIASPHDSAYQEVQRLLREKYAFLSPAALLRIATGAAYGWK